MSKYLIQTVSVGAAGAVSVDFNNIPQDYSDLYLVISSRITSASTNSDNMFMQLNTVTSGYNARILQQNGPVVVSSVTPNSITSKGFIGTSSSTSVSGGGWSITKVLIPNYKSSSNKTVSSETSFEGNMTSQNDVGNFIATNSSPVAAPITFISLTHPNASFAQYSTAYLYGIKSGDDLVTRVTPQATGGTITYANGYTIHTFTSSGTFTPKANMQVEYIVVAGGGGGGGSQSDGAAGSGGGGGFRSSVVGGLSGRNSAAETKLSVTSGTAYTVTVGGGGAGYAGNNGSYGTGTQGGSSVFGSITSIGGGGGGGNYQASSFTGGGNGGCGGGGAYGVGFSGFGYGTAGQGFDGWSGDGSYNQGGGGGAASAANSFGYGGNAIGSSITGTNVGYSGGAGVIPGSGAGTAAAYGGAAASAGTANRGGGGGGGAYTNWNGASGGSGVVIIRY